MKFFYLIFFFLSLFGLFCSLLIMLKYKRSMIFKKDNFYHNKNLKIITLIFCFIVISIFLNIIYALIISILILYFLWTLSVSKKQKNKKIIDKQILETIRLFRNYVSAGQSFVQTIESVSKQIKEPLSSEFKEILNKVNLGISLEKALKSSSLNVSNEQYKFFTDALIISYSTGIKVSDILLKIEESLNQKTDLNSKIDVLTSQVRFSGKVVSFMPFIIVFLVCFFEPDMILTLFTTLIGNFVLLISVIMILTGAFIMKKISDIKL